MSVKDYLDKIYELCLTYNKENKIWYIEPLWRYYLDMENIGDKEKPKNFYYDLYEILKLERDKRNVQEDNLGKLISLLSNTMSVANQTLSEAENKMLVKILDSM